MKVLIGPMNIAAQPYYLARGLRKFGIEATSIMYGSGTFKYEADWKVELPRNPIERVTTFYNVLQKVIENDYDIIHFFQRSFFMSIPPKRHDKLTGFDIPILKLRGKRIAYRFTGWEVISREIELKNNPYSAFKHGWDGHFDTYLNDEYLDFLRCYCDVFMVVDPMMKEHIPEAEIVPRILNVEDFEEVGIEKKDCPLVLHAPSNTTYKGSKFILKALEELRDEGINFELKLLNRVPYTEAIQWYKKADIIVDQILIGWYGVLAIECMAMGKPVAVYMRNDLVKTPEEVPVHNINIDDVKQRLRELIQDYELRRYLAERGREYVKQVHDESVVIPKLISVYKKIMESGVTYPRNNSDITFLYLQRKDIEEKMNRLRVLEVRISRLMKSKTMNKINEYVYTVIRKLLQVAKKILKKFKMLINLVR